MATYFVDNANGNDGSDGLSEANAWATIDKAMNTIAAGDKVWVQGGTDYTETATIDTVGTGTSWIVYEGYTTTTGDGGSFTIDGGSARTNGITSDQGASYHRFENMILENHTAEGFEATIGDMMVFVNCEFNSNSTHGIDVDNGCLFVDCSATGNSTDGFAADSACHYINCVSHNNTGDGFASVSGGAFYNCRASSNGAAGFTSRGDVTFGPVSVLNCTVDGDGKDSDDGFRSLSNSFAICIVNSIFYDCTDGIDGNSGAAPPQIGFNNLVNSNTADYSGWNPTGDDVTGAPSFTAEASQDYTLGSGSAAIEAGSDNSGTSSPGMDIGAHQKAGAAGAAGIIKMAGPGGGMVG